MFSRLFSQNRPVPPTLQRHRLRSVLMLVLILSLSLPSPQIAQAAPSPLPPGFEELTVFAGLQQPTVVQFAADGRVFVAEKSGIIKVFDNLTDTTPTIFADLNVNVYNFWDRGLLGLTLDPNFPSNPYVYVLYTYDAEIGGTAPRWGTPDVLSDPCPYPPGALSDGCVVSGRLSRLQANGNVVTGSEQVLIEDWCQQYPSHSIGSMVFGADGALYVSGGEGASFQLVDYGQDGTPLNPCGDPPGGVGGTLSPPTAEGGALRSQDLRTSGDPVGLDGTILRLNPATGAALPDNPMAGNADQNARRIIATGLRNPFRMTVRPGTNELWVGDVGWLDWEEINRIPNPTDSVVENFGWPCYEGQNHQPGYDSANLNICENLYGSAGTVTNPYFTYNHNSRVVLDEACRTGSSSSSGLAFYTGGSYPAEYNGALFFADFSRDCIWAMLKDASGLPDPGLIRTFVFGAKAPVDLKIGPGGDLFYVDFTGGTIRRIRFVGNTGGTLPSPWLSQNVGSVGVPGSASYSNGTFTVAGSGADIGGTADAFRYVYQPLSGDGTITARVATLQSKSDLGSKAGVMIRESLAPGARNAAVFVTRGSGVAFQRRLSTNGSTTSTAGAAVTAPYWVRLVRSGNTVSGYQSSDGVNWVQIGSETISMAADIYVGLAVTSHNNTATVTATFDNVTVTAAPSTNQPPTAIINTPPAGTTWKVGDLINFSGSATDPEDGILPPSSMFWTLTLQHCPSNCHPHLLQTVPGGDSGSFFAPDHEYPSYLELQLTVTDSGGLQDTETLRLDPQTVPLTFQSAPSGLQLTVGGSTYTTPFMRTVIVGSNNSISAPSPQTLAGTGYQFASWSDTGAQSHDIVAPASPITYTAQYTAATQTDTPTATPTGSVPTNTPTATPTIGAPTSTPTRTPTGGVSTLTPTPTRKGGPPPTRTPTPTSGIPTNTPTSTPTSVIPTSTYTPTPTSGIPTSTSTPTPTRINTPSGLTSTGFLAPSADEPEIIKAGDNNGYEVSPGNAYVADGLVATDANSGSSTDTSCTSQLKDKHRYYNFNIPPLTAVNGIEVRLTGSAATTAGAPQICIQLSWSRGDTWTAAQSIPLTTVNTTYILGSPTDTWGRTWALGDFSNTNFRVRVIDVASSTANSFLLDAIAVNITYQP